MRRNDLEICAEILQIAMMGAKKTHIVYKANLNSEIVKKYLMRLIENNLLQPDKGRGYCTTQKGSKFIEEYRKIRARASRY